MATKTKAPSKYHKWDAKKKRWVLKSFEERQKGRNILLQGKNNPIRIIHDTVRNVNAAKKLRKEAAARVESNKKKSNLKAPTRKTDPNTKYTPKKGTAAASIQKKLIKGGHTQEGLNKKAARHAAWKKARKEGTLGDWEKKYHPDRTPQYKNKKKKVEKKGTGTDNKKKKKSEIMFPTGPGGFRGI